MTAIDGLSNDARRLWVAAQALNAAAAAVSPAAAVLPPLLFFTDPDRTPRPWETAARLPAGAGVVFRGFGRPEAEDVAHRLRTVTREAGVRLLIGLDADLADRVEADGLHLPQRALTAAYALSGRRPDWILTGAVHDAATLAGAGDLQAAVLSPVFPAGGSSAGRAALGEAAFTDAAAHAPVPTYALGGITPERAEGLTHSGACGLAAVEAIQAAFGP